MAKKPIEEIEIGPSLCPDHAPFRRYVDGVCIQEGIGVRGDGLDPGLEGTCVEYGPMQENGRRPVKSSWTCNAPGSRVSSGATSDAYRSGWDRIFSKPAGKPSQAN